MTENQNPENEPVKDLHDYPAKLKKVKPLSPNELKSWQWKQKEIMEIVVSRIQGETSDRTFEYTLKDVPTDSEFFLVCLNRVRFLAQNYINQEKGKPAKDRISRNDQGVILATIDFCTRMEKTLTRDIYMSKFMPEELEKLTEPKGL